MDKVKDLARRTWAKYRRWPLWAQIVTGIVAVSLVLGPFIPKDVEDAKSSEGTTLSVDTAVPISAVPDTHDTAGSSATNTTAPETPPPTTAEPTTQAPTTALPNSFSGLNPSRIFARDFDPWPFTLDTGLLKCEGTETTSVIVIFGADDGTIYAVNGSARSVMEQRGWHDVQEIWLDNPVIPGTKVDLGKIIDLGLSLC